MELSIERLTKHYESKIAVDCVSAALKPGVYELLGANGAGSSADIFRTNTFYIFGRYIWSPYLLITVPVMIGLCVTPFTVKNWSKRLKV